MVMFDVYKNVAIGSSLSLLTSIRVIMGKGLIIVSHNASQTNHHFVTRGNLTMEV